MTIPFFQFVDETASTLGYSLDAAQRDAVKRLSNLARQLGEESDTVGFISRIFRKKLAARGMYIWGGVGRGKTFLMDLFFDHVVFEKKTPHPFSSIYAGDPSTTCDFAGQRESVGDRW